MSPSRQKGAQTGNLNALKHGFYSRTFRHAELSDLEAMLEQGLEGEINALRISIRRLLELTNENTDIETGISLLYAVGTAGTSLATMLRTQAILGGSRQDDTYAAITQALSEVNKELFHDRSS